MPTGILKFDLDEDFRQWRLASKYQDLALAIYRIWNKAPDPGWIIEILEDFNIDINDLM